MSHLKKNIKKNVEDTFNDSLNSKIEKVEITIRDILPLNYCFILDAHNTYYSNKSYKSHFKSD